eukprot:3030878-Alexandrium_andersonii.AAC.1
MQGSTVGAVQGGTVQIDTMQRDIRVDSMKGDDAIHTQGSIVGSVQGDTVQADIRIGSMQGDAIYDWDSVLGSLLADIRVGF